MKTIGIIGGFGPETTAKFLMLLISLWQKKNPEKRPEILLWNAPVNNNIEREFISSGKNADKFLPLLKTGAKKLEKAGADFLVLPCNSLHIFIEDIKNSVNIPVLNIMEETTKFLVKKRVSKIGLFGTTITNSSHIFDSFLEKHKIEIIRPNQKDQTKLNHLIHNLIIGKRLNGDLKNFIHLVKKTKLSGTKNILLACTDLQLLSIKMRNINFIDTLDILAKATVEKMLKQ